ncbi:RluA family pseudouridine synthase [Candidatus Peregrinibacteria bacterium]|nr:RluA family pseudouridine synthase [Candidatus Peregrinibacteria bacterium]
MKTKSLLQILYEDPHLFAMQKPPRMACVPASHIPIQETVLGKIQWMFAKKGIQPYLLHRLDAQTSGVLLFGKHAKDREALEGIFRSPETHKKYTALVKGVPHGRMITVPLPARASKEKIPAQTDFRILEIFPVPPCALVEAEIKTGRKHQIRQHFAGIGCPIILDSRYGDERFNRRFRIAFRLGRQFLHAKSIAFSHPMLKKQIFIEAPLPPDLQSVLKKLRLGK